MLEKKVRLKYVVATVYLLIFFTSIYTGYTSIEEQHLLKHQVSVYVYNQMPKVVQETQKTIRDTPKENLNVNNIGATYYVNNLLTYIGVSVKSIFIIPVAEFYNTQGYLTGQQVYSILLLGSNRVYGFILVALLEVCAITYGVTASTEYYYRLIHHLLIKRIDEPWEIFSTWGRQLTFGAILMLAAMLLEVTVVRL